MAKAGRRQYVDSLRPAQRRLLAGLSHPQRRLLVRQARYRRVVSRVLRDVQSTVLAQVRDGDVLKAASDKQVRTALRAMDLDGFAVLMEPTEALIEDVMKASGAQALAKVGVGVGEFEDIVNDRAVEYARERAAELVGKRITPSGRVVNNPNAEFAITDSTRELLRGTITKAIEEGWTRGQLASELEDSYAFSNTRAALIARNETGAAHVAGNMEGWRASEVVVGKQSILGSRHDIDDICDDNAAAGVIGLNDEFPSGDDASPYHPNCVCDILPVLAGEQEE